MEVPESVREEKRKIGNGGRSDVEFTFEKGRWGHLGEATLWNRVKSHTDVGERWYPEILGRIRAEQGKQAVEERQTTKVWVNGKEFGLIGVEKLADMDNKEKAIEAH